jgi:hypothetical protein
LMCTMSRNHHLSSVLFHFLMQAEKEKESEAMGLSSHEKCSMTGKKVLRHIYVEAPGAKALETPPCLFFFLSRRVFSFLVLCLFFFFSFSSFYTA